VGNDTIQTGSRKCRVVVPTTNGARYTCPILGCGVSVRTTRADLTEKRRRALCIVQGWGGDRREVEGRPVVPSVRRPPATFLKGTSN